MNSSTEAQFGLSLPNRGVLFGLKPAVLLEAAQLADESDLFGSVWVGDNFLSKPRLEALVTLAAVAARTSRVALGTICLATFPLRNPLVLALQWASLDVLSEGRTILAVCNGGSARDGIRFAKELEAFNVRSGDRVSIVEETIPLLRQLWSGVPVSHSGQHHSFQGVVVEPRPIQERIPIILAANPPLDAPPHLEERVLRRIARLADGWQTDGLPPALFAERWAKIRTYAREEGREREVTHVSLHLMVNINNDPALARRRGVEFLEHYYGAAGGVSEDKLESWLAFGPPDAVAAKIAEFIDAGCSTVVLRFVDADQLHQIERCIGEVLPQLAGRRVALPA